MRSTPLLNSCLFILLLYIVIIGAWLTSFIVVIEALNFFQLKT